MQRNLSAENVLVFRQNVQVQAEGYEISPQGAQVLLIGRSLFIRAYNTISLMGVLRLVQEWNQSKFLSLSSWKQVAKEKHHKPRFRTQACLSSFQVQGISIFVILSPRHV